MGVLLRKLGMVLVLEGLLALQSRAAEPLSPAEREKLQQQAAELVQRADGLYQAGKAAEAVPLLRQSLAICERLYPASAFPEGHSDLAYSLSCMGFLLQAMGEYGQALPYWEKALAMRERLYPRDRYKDGHPDLAISLNNMGFLLQAMGEYGKALPYYEKALAMRERLYPRDRYKDGHPDLAQSLNNMGFLLPAMGEYGQALPYLEKALAMNERLYPRDRYKDGHPNLAQSLNNLGFLLQAMGEYGKALPYLEKALAMNERLYPRDRYKDGHPELAKSLNNLGSLLKAMGENGKALPYYEKALAMNERLYPRDRYKDGHPELAQSLSSMGSLLKAMGEYGQALPYYEKALAMRERLYPRDRYKDGHPDLALSLNNLGALLHAMGENGKALPYFEKALAMRERLFPRDGFKDGHPELALSLNNLGALLEEMGEYGKALPYYEKALAMNERLYPRDRYKDGHPDLALSLNNLGALLHAMGENGQALPYYEKALAMNERLYPRDKFQDGHPDLALSLNNLGALLQAMGEYGQALPYLKGGLESYSRQARRETTAAPEAQALAWLRSLPSTRDGFLDTSRNVPDEPAASVYEQLWPSKGLLLELLSRRHQAAAAAAADPQTLKLWQRLVEVRRQLNRLAVEPPLDLAVRDRRLLQLTEEQERLERDLAGQLPTLARHRALDSKGPSHLLQHLPPGTAFLDLVRHGHAEKGKFAGYRYQGFVLAPGQSVRRVDLGDAKAIDEAITSWRGSIDRLADSHAPGRLKELLWDKLAAQLPAGTKVVYVCPDGDLTRLPWAALPGSKPNTLLLEEVAVAVVPSGKWLLAQLLYPQPEAAGADTVVAVGAIDYGAAPQGSKAEYAPLAQTSRELQRVLEAFGVGPESGLRQRQATAAVLKERLARARYAHLATHGYFDQAGLSGERQQLHKQLQQWHFGLERATERVGVKQHPLGYVGLALAGANDPTNAADGGILTGLGIVDLPLEQLRLCVLSACETGLGDLTEGEGVIGLQRAFHVAGCPNVIGSLWKVNDTATAALMAQFYHELRVNKRPPLEALQQAQLTIYRHPDRIQALAGERGRPALEAAAKLGSAATVKPDEKGKTTPTKLWAAFVLSGVGTTK